MASERDSMELGNGSVGFRSQKITPAEAHQRPDLALSLWGNSVSTTQYFESISPNPNPF